MIQRFHTQTRVLNRNRDVILLNIIFDSLQGLDRVREGHCFAIYMYIVPSSTLLLNATISRHIKPYRTQDPTFVEAYMRAINVDHPNSGGDNDNSVYTLYMQESKARISRRWIWNTKSCNKLTRIVRGDRMWRKPSFQEPCPSLKLKSMGPRMIESTKKIKRTQRLCLEWLMSPPVKSIRFSV